MKASFLLSFVWLVLISTTQAQTAKEYAVPLQAVVSENPASIILKWPKDTAGISYEVFKKNKLTNAWGLPIATLPISATTYTDIDITIGKDYEYCLRRKYTDEKRFATGYINAAINKTIEPNNGTLLLLVDDNYSIPLNTEINELILDLIKDGWAVKRQNITRSTPVTDVKEKIRKTHMELLNQYPLKSLLLLGHIPVPYSGGFMVSDGEIPPPDGHTEHSGAWSSDVYYGSLTDAGFWTDNIVNDNSPSRAENKNIPGDGKFDPMIVTGASVSLQVGRIDLTNMPAFALNDTLLTQQYLTKLHAYKTAQTSVIRAGLIDDQLGVLEGEAFTPMSWNDFTTFFGDSVFEKDYVTATRQQPYLFTSGVGFGNYSACSGVVTTNQFANDSIQQIFTLLFGSYFGDWDSQNNLLRAALASKKGGLASAWSGRPYWHLHHMALGATIGYSALLTQNNAFNVSPGMMGYEDNGWPGIVSVNLMGDPTLRLFMREPMLPITTSSANDSIAVTISWPAMPNVSGYLLSKTASLSNGFKASIELPANTTSWTDLHPFFGNSKYMVRPIYLEQTPSGSYYNVGLGAIDSAYSKNTVGLHETHTIENLQATLYPNPNNGQFTLSFNEPISATIDITDIQGKLVFSKTNIGASENINVSSLTKGCYFVHVKNGSVETVKKLIIQ